MPTFYTFGGWFGPGIVSPGNHPAVRKAFRSPKAHARYVVAGVTKDSTGALLGACTVRLFDTATNVLVATTDSDESGNFAFYVSPDTAYYIVAYKPGTPDVAGTTVNTITAVGE